ncbi:alpha/beta hydrolase [Haloferacaceae archaeon DSL9]
MSETVLLPGGRDARGSLDVADGGSPADTTADAVVVACPPHPQHRGHRGDERLVAVSDALVARGIDCLRFDYGPWDEGYGECTDADSAVSWAVDRYERVGLFGFSFGGAVALITAASRRDLDAVSALAPARRLNRDADAAAALDHVACPAQVVVGTRDDVVEWEPVVERARALDVETVAFEADHFFVGRAPKVAATVSEFLVPHLS